MKCKNILLSVLIISSLKAISSSQPLDGFEEFQKAQIAGGSLSELLCLRGNLENYSNFEERKEMENWLESRIKQEEAKKSVQPKSDTKEST